MKPALQPLGQRLSDIVTELLSSPESPDHVVTSVSCPDCGQVWGLRFEEDAQFLHAHRLQRANNAEAASESCPASTNRLNLGRQTTESLWPAPSRPQRPRVGRCSGLAVTSQDFSDQYVSVLVVLRQALAGARFAQPTLGHFVIKSIEEKR